MAGSDPAFDSDLFRVSIRAAMTMGMPEGDLTATFRWSEQKTFSRADPSGKPYNWSATPVTDVAHPDVTVPVAVEYSGQQIEDGTTVGVFSHGKAKITVLDDDYELVNTADQVLLGGKIYDITFKQTENLFDVGVWYLFAQARSAA